ncbi:hypothetical protein OIU79_026236 [Salix purpurea]|uniref:Uncharacterized protein n=1 Tax=Salix purpurea TaxID=77065 RepID=A0A9Q0VQY4_SALPP|nr:hypothetical protein OIU79_026236 [Salix purpurea]
MPTLLSYCLRMNSTEMNRKKARIWIHSASLIGPGTHLEKQRRVYDKTLKLKCHFPAKKHCLFLSICGTTMHSRSCYKPMSFSYEISCGGEVFFVLSFLLPPSLVSCYLPEQPGKLAS